MADHFWTTRQRKTGLVAGVPLLLLSIILLSLNAILGPVIGRKIKAAVMKGSDSLYQVNFSHIHINIFTGSAELEDIQLRADTGRAPDAGQLAEGSARQLRITGAGLFAYLFHKKLEIGNITLHTLKYFLTGLSNMAF